MLARFIEHRHDDVDTVRFAADRRDDALDVRIMIVRRHRHFHAIKLIFALIGAHVADDKQVITANRTLQHALGLSGTEAGTARFQQESVFISAVKTVEILVF